MPKCVEGFPKPGEGFPKPWGRKIQIVTKEIQSPGKQKSKFLSSANRAFSRACERIHIATLRADFSLRLAPRTGARGRAKARRRNASPRGRSRACFARAVPQSMPASLPAALTAFWGTKSSDSTDLENRKQNSCRTMRLSAISTDNKDEISSARPAFSPLRQHCVKARVKISPRWLELRLYGRRCIGRYDANGAFKCPYAGTESEEADICGNMMCY